MWVKVGGHKSSPKGGPPGGPESTFIPVLASNPFKDSFQAKLQFTQLVQFGSLSLLQWRQHWSTAAQAI